ncbi:MAG: glutamate mutase L [Clostridia bacterium]|nr:glutamate mutase L [Clostridia bacterium]
MSRADLQSILATDCGSTTTKAILIEKTGGEYRLVVRGEAPTTVEAPFEDVTVGVRNAVREVEELAGRRILTADGEGIETPRTLRGDGVDAYVSTSSAGGGLQMMVAGVIQAMTTESAQRAALGAGAIVMDAISIDDGRKPHVKIQRVRSLRPDMILLSGGVDGGTIAHVVEMAELLKAAQPKPRLGAGYKLPVIYAGNRDAREHVRRTLGDLVDLRVVDNIRPVLEREVLGPARHEIHNLFMEHVMAQAPGYAKLMTWTAAPIMPTPGAVGLLIETVARERGIDVVGVDIGGATTDVFSVFDGTFNRTVSANLGMSYSMANVLLEAGAANIQRWLPFEISEADLRNRIRNKMIRPTSIPETLEDLLVEQAVAREALRLAFEHHKTLAVGLKGVHQQRFDPFNQELSGQTLVDLMALDLIIGSGGVLSHAPRRAQAALMMIDAFQPEGVTELAVDSIFMMPQLGVLSTVHPEAAAHVFERDCLIRLGTVVAPVGQPPAGAQGQPALVAEIRLPDGREVRESLAYGELKLVPLGVGEEAEAELRPGRGLDLGRGAGTSLRARLAGGVVGIVLDARGRRPFGLPADADARRERLVRWFEALDAYPAQVAHLARRP